MWISPATLFSFSIFVHLGALVLLFTGNWYDFLLAACFYTIMRGCGISMTYHRYYSHSCWEPPKWFRVFGTYFACLTGEGTPMTWTAWHVTHHRTSDTPSDPHSPTYKSKIYMWLFPMFADIELKYAIKLRKNEVAMFFHKYYWFVHLSYFLFWLVVYPYGIISCYLAPAGFTWAMGAINNMATHNNKYGYQTYDTGDKSRNVSWSGYLGFGEGWHNNHHHSPSNYRFGHNKKEWDAAAWLIEKLDPSKKDPNGKD